MKQNKRDGLQRTAVASIKTDCKISQLLNLKAGYIFSKTFFICRPDKARTSQMAVYLNLYSFLYINPAAVQVLFYNFWQRVHRDISVYLKSILFQGSFRWAQELGLLKSSSNCFSFSYYYNQLNNSVSQLLYKQIYILGVHIWMLRLFHLPVVKVRIFIQLYSTL